MEQPRESTAPAFALLAEWLEKINDLHTQADHELDELYHQVYSYISNWDPKHGMTFKEAGILIYEAGLWELGSNFLETGLYLVSEVHQFTRMLRQLKTGLEERRGLKPAGI